MKFWESIKDTTEIINGNKMNSRLTQIDKKNSQNSQNIRRIEELN